MADSVAAIARLQAELGATPKDTQPYEHALAAHRLGLAEAEATTGNPQERLRRALACFDVAGALLDPRFHPVEHARVLTAAGAARRGLGDAAGALRLFRGASTLAAGRVGGDEAAAIANNVGLALLDAGDIDAAVTRFDEAIGGFDTAGAEGRRGRASALHNRGLALAAAARPHDLQAAITDHEAALAAVSFDEAPLHHAMVQHSRGVAAAALADAETDPEAAARWRGTAIDAFTRALDVFSWPEHAVQHAIASFNLGRSWAATGDEHGLRRAVLSFEDAVTAFDPRHQSEPWRHAYAELAATEARLATDHPGCTRADHLVALLHADSAGAQRLMRRRLARWLLLPAPARDAAVADVAAAAIRDGDEAGADALVLLLAAVIELPIEAQAVVLDALLAARAAAGAGDREVADKLVDRAIGEALVGPQRVFVRDHLIAGGFERP